MPAKFHLVAEGHLLEIWAHTAAKWSEAQADAYVVELIYFANELGSQRHRWKRVPEDSLSNVFCLRHRHHVLFFRELPDVCIGVIAVLHERMDLPMRLREVLSGDSEF